MYTDQFTPSGGFFNTSTNFGDANTPSTAQISGGKRASRTAPIVIRQALDCGDDGVKIWGTEIQIVSIVARVRNIRVQSTKITYTIQDITGRMKAVFWLDQEAMDEDDTTNTKIQQNEYVQIFGNVKTTNKDKKTLMAFKIIPVTDINAITFHYLQCINNKLKMESDSKKDKVPATSMVGTYDNASSYGLNDRQLMVYNIIRTSKLDQGINKQDIYAQLQGGMSNVEFEKILEWMVNEGHIYSTIDDHHFKST